MKLVVSRFLTGIGLLCLAYGFLLLVQHYNPNRLSFALSSYKDPKFASTEAVPAVLAIPGLQISLPIIPSHISGKSWPTTDRGVSYLADSVIPGSKGNAIFWGHNWTSLLGGLVHTKQGQKVSVLFTDGTSKTFTVEYIGVVSPNQSSILKNTGDRRLTIYTCTGFLDSKRFVVVARYDES